MVYLVLDQHIVLVFSQLWRNSIGDNQARNLLVIVIGVLVIRFGKLQSHKNFACLHGRRLPASLLFVLDSINESPRPIRFAQSVVVRRRTVTMLLSVVL
jgi:hypothetical protein